MRRDPFPPSVATQPAPQLDLVFSRAPSGASYLSRQHAGYPFHVGRVLAQPDGPGARVIVQSSSGGLFEHDDVRQHLVIGAGACARVETAAATIVHSMTGGIARSHIRIEAQNDARFEWLAHPSILFPGANLVSRIDAVLHPGAVILLTDAYTRHDPKENGAAPGLLDATISVRDAEGQLRALDRCHINGASDAPLGGVNATFAAHGGLMVLTLDPALAETISIALEQALADSDYAGAGLLPGACGVFARFLANDSGQLRAMLALGVSTVRTVLGQSGSR